MKFNQLFILSILTFLAFVFVMEYRMPKKFIWTPSFSHTDKQPFGCYVFDSVLVKSLPKGYRVTKKSLYQMRDDKQPKGVLVVADDLSSFSRTDYNALQQMARNGSKIMLAGNRMSTVVEKKLSCRFCDMYVSMSLQQYAAQRLHRDTLRWTADNRYKERLYRFYPQLCDHYISVKKSTTGAKLLAGPLGNGRTYPIEKEEWAMAVSYPVGKGEIILVSTPLIFTNYALLDGENHEYIFRLLSQMGNLPIVRTEAYMPQTAQLQQSPLRYFLSQKPLKWAVYLALLTIVLFMLFTAKRRQRTIPVMEEPQNKSLEFVELIGTLYYQKKDYRDLVMKKFMFFAELMRRRWQVDITNREDDGRTFSLISSQTGMEQQEVELLVNDLRRMKDSERQITPKASTLYIEKINEIIKSI
ncbi:MAG: DUF4350 domain-containing protein [Prevotellaceae bacterium]|nr:DUF4350 domain-containing protein [Prevotellaceae bacterium]MDY6130536.1 DUF4350 domain-containing protein [Prevotella sp.]